MSKGYLDWILVEPGEGSRRRKKRCCNDFVVKNKPKMVFM